MRGPATDYVTTELNRNGIMIYLTEYDLELRSVRKLKRLIKEFLSMPRKLMLEMRQTILYEARFNETAEIVIRNYYKILDSKFIHFKDEILKIYAAKLMEIKIDTEPEFYDSRIIGYSYYYVRLFEYTQRIKCDFHKSRFFNMITNSNGTYTNKEFNVFVKETVIAPVKFKASNKSNQYFDISFVIQE